MDRLLAEVRSGGQSKPASGSPSSSRPSRGISTEPLNKSTDSNVDSLRRRLADVENKIKWNEQQLKKSGVYRAVSAVGDYLPVLDSFKEELESERADIIANIQDIESSRQQINQSGGYGEGGFGAALRRGIGAAQSTQNALEALIGDTEQEDIEGIIAGRNRVQRAARNKEEQDAYERFQSADGFLASAREIFTNPRLLTNVAIESIPSSLYSIVGGVVGGAAGAVAGAPAGPAGAVVGGRVGGGLGSGIGSFATEFGSTMLDTLEKNGVDLDDPEALKAAIENPEIMAEAKERGLRRGLAVAAFDALSVGLAGKLGSGRVASKVLGDAAEAGAGRRAGAVIAGGVVEAPVQGALGSAGEASAQLLADGEITSPQDIVAEFAGELPAGFVESSVGAGVELSRGNADTQQRGAEDDELFTALAAREGANPVRQGGGLIQDANAVELGNMGNVSAGGLNYTPTQILEIATNNQNNPRIADIMSQPVSDATKVEQVARILNQEEAARVEPEAVRRISGMIGGTTPVSRSRQIITDELSKIDPAIVAESPALSSIASVIETGGTGKQFVNGLRNIVNNYQPTTPQGETFIARPERGGKGSVVMTQDQVADEAQREREASQAFRMADVRQRRFDTATGAGTQREDLRAGAPEPEAQFFLNPEVYGEELGGTVATIVGAEGGRVRIQYEQGDEIVSEDVEPTALFDRVVRGTPRMSQDLESNLRNPDINPKTGRRYNGVVGSDMNPRRSVDRTRTRAIVPAESGLPEVISPTRFTGFEQNTDQLPVEAEQPAPRRRAEALPAPEPVEAASTPEVTAPPAQRQLPAPRRRTPPKVEEVQQQDAEEEVDVDNDPRMVEHNQRFDDAVESVSETENATEVRKLAKKMIKEGLIDEESYVDIDERMKDVPPADRWDEGMSALEDAIEQQRDTLASDIEDEIYSEADQRASEGESNVRYSGRRDRVRNPRRKASDVVKETPLTKKAEAEGQATETPAPDIDYDAVIKDRLDKIAERGSQGKVVASRLRSLLKQNNYNSRQLYYAFQMGEVMSRVLPKNSKVDILFVPSITATNARSAAASGIELGSEASGSYRAYEISQNGFRGLITMSLSDSLLEISRENAAHEAFHVIQDILRVEDPDGFNTINETFRDGMRIADLDPSIVRKLKTITLDGERSVYDDLVANFGDTPLALDEAQAVAFGALVDAKDRGTSMKGLKASFIRFVDFLSDLRREYRRLLNRDGVVSIADIFDGFRTGSYDYEGPAPLADGDSVRYSARRYNPEKGLDSAIESLKEDIADVGGEIVDVSTIDELASSEQIPVITLKELIGKKLFPTISDRTAAAALYTGIDSSQTVAVPLLGGPNFPLRQSNIDAMVAWANRGGAVLTKKMKKVKEGANYMMIVMGSADMHKSNTTVNNSYFATLEAYARDGRISGDASDKLADMIRSAKEADTRIAKYLSEFPSFSDVEALDAYIHRISFDARKRIMSILESKAALELGAPSMKQILDATREPSMAGHRWGDGVLVVEVIDDGMVSLGKDGTQAHPDFPLGIKGRVVGRLETPVSYELLWQDFIKESNSKTAARGKKATPETARYEFQQSLPIVEVTQDLVDRIGDLSTPNIDSARQARLASDMAASNWRTSDQAKNKGGVSIQEFVDAINNSPAKAVLNEYTAKDVTADVKAEKMRVFQLGQDGQIFFALKKGDPQYAEDYGIDIPMVGKDEVMVTAVINNEQGARGIAGPAVMLKAIEEGATVLDCFAVKSKKFPDGFLPALYEVFGFTKVAEVPFAPEYYSKQKLADAVKYWQDSSSGYNPKTDGYPPLVIMKWTGTDEERNGVLDRYLQSGIEGLLTGRARANVEAATDEFDVTNRNSSREGGATAVSERAGGAEGARAGAPLASRARAVVEEIAGLSDQQLENLGLSKNDRLNAQKRMAGVQYSGRTGRAAYTPERTEQIIKDYTDPRDDKKSKGWMTFMSPDQFLGLTLSKDGRDRLATMDPTKTRARELNIDELRRVSQPLFLEIADPYMASGKEQPRRVMGHEGRHRMAAFKAAGIDQIPVILVRQNGAAQIEDLAGAQLAPQRAGRNDPFSNGDTETVIDEAVPINNENADRIREMMDGEGVRFSGRRPTGQNRTGPVDLRQPQTVRRNAPKFRTGPAILGVDPTVAKHPKLTLWYERLVNRARPIKQLVKNIDDFYNDKTNIDRAEQLMGGRAAYQTQEFHLNELKPLLRELTMRGLTMDEVETYLHNRHAEERNGVIRSRNDAFPDGGSGINDAAARSYMVSLSPEKRARLEAVAKKVDAMTGGTLQILQDSGVESAETIQNLRNTYKFYVPLFREGVDGGHALGTRGASVEGSSLKSAIGSSKPVSNIIANIILQREAAINRAEANRLGNTVFQAALDNQDPAFWMVIDPSKATLEQVRKQLAGMNMDPDLAEEIFKSPTKRAYNKRTGTVETMVDTGFKRQPNVFATRVDGTDKYIVFNPDEKMAADIASILKNDDLPTLNGAAGAFIENMGSITRIWSQLRTQYMPEFGPVNFARDMWGVMLNLSSTPLDGEQFKVMGRSVKYAKKLIRVIRATDSGEPIPQGSEEVADLFDRFEKAGGRTAIRESFFKDFDRNPEELEKELQQAIKQLQAGKTSAPQSVINWVTAWNDALENATRLSAFKAGLDNGMTDAQAAEVAKSITVNFNQRGQWTREINALYGFANASIASTDRNMKTMLGKSGKKILIGGIGLGVIQGLLLAAAGYDEDDVPEWVKDHAFIIPLGLFSDSEKYIAIPMPYFYNMFPAFGRRMVEAARGQLTFGQFLGGTAKVAINSVNPIAYGAGFIEFVSPSVFDMFVQYWQNEDGLGRRIYNDDFNDLNPTTGMSRARGDTTVMYSMYSKVAEVINAVSGGDEYERGTFSPTPEEVKFFVEQALPPLQFLYRSAGTLEKGLAGDTVEANEVAFLRRFYGETSGKTAEGGKFYENVKEINELKTTIKAREEAGADTSEIYEENPKASLVDYVGSNYRIVSDLRRERRELILGDAPRSEVTAKDEEITAAMKNFNDLVAEAEQ
jgi:hypothetical protein